MSNLRPTILDSRNKNTDSLNNIWPLYRDTVPHFAFAENVFSQEQCKSIINIGKNSLPYSDEPSRTICSEIRGSTVSWIRPVEGNEWIFQILSNAILVLNKEYFQFDLFGFAHAVQFTEYQSPGGKYDAHVDTLYEADIRKLSISVQLSDENDYEGGDFICNYGHEEIMPRTQGTAIAFPSYALHGVKPVTKGTRYSLVAWITGPQFK